MWFLLFLLITASFIGCADFRRFSLGWACVDVWMCSDMEIGSGYRIHLHSFRTFERFSGERC